MLVFSKITIQMHYLKAYGCNKIKRTKIFPVIQQEGSGPFAVCGTGLLSSITGETAGSELPPFQGALAFCVISLPLALRSSACHTVGTSTTRGR